MRETEEEATAADTTGDDSDWLEGSDREDEGASSTNQSGTGQSQSMSERDLSKVQRKMYDEGYREGISAGKESMIQPGFDDGFVRTGAPIGRQYGRLCGTLYALETLLADRQKGRAMQRRSMTSASSSHDDDVGDEKQQIALRDMKQRVAAIQLKDLVGPDWEAIAHEREHGGDVGNVQRESDAERIARESIVPALQAQADRLLDEVWKAR